LATGVDGRDVSGVGTGVASVEVASLYGALGCAISGRHVSTQTEESPYSLNKPLSRPGIGGGSSDPVPELEGGVISSIGASSSCDLADAPPVLLSSSRTC